MRRRLKCNYEYNLYADKEQYTRVFTAIALFLLETNAANTSTQSTLENQHVFENHGSLGVFYWTFQDL